MLPDYLPDRISLSQIQDLCEKYKFLVSETIKHLEHARIDVIPKEILNRRPPHITKNELITLMKWKLKHGTFRPSLMKLVLENSDAVVERSTGAAFALYESSAGTRSGADIVQQVLKILTQLRGVGPATASLLLSVYDPQAAPFFSDELFRYVHISADSTGRIKGWDRKIKYDLKECLELFTMVGQLRARLNDGLQGEDEAVKALDIEQAAFVLGNTESSTAPKQRSKKRQVETLDAQPAAKSSRRKFTRKC